jgi:hypothetical protein
MLGILLVSSLNRIPPPPLVIQSILEAKLHKAVVSKSRRRSKLLIEVEEKPLHIIETKEANSNNNLGIEQEIDCPRCHDTMALCSDFDRLGYVCEECDFLLYLN